MSARAMGVAVATTACVLGLCVVGCSGDAGPVGEEAAPAADVVASGSQPVRVVGTAPAASGGFPAVVTLEPLGPLGPLETPPPARSGYLGQSGSTFQPSLVWLRTGEVLEVSNDEDVIHNVHVLDPEGETVFNVTSLFGAVYRHTFDRPGVYSAGCGVHPAMAARIVVTDAPFGTVASTDGRFEIDGVPPGTYRARVWHVDEAERSERTVEIGTSRSELDLGG